MLYGLLTNKKINTTIYTLSRQYLDKNKNEKINLQFKSATTKRLTPSTTTTRVCKLKLTLEVFHSGKNIL